MKVTLIPNWKKAWKFASIQIPVAGLAVLTSLDYASQVWFQMSSSIQSRIPYSNLIGIAFLALSIIGRLMKFTGKDKDNASTNSE
ncbi:MAG: hypothetical protein [Caudoviricetes sp.]|nr:MAG: hypothetical protein [Caudoviricetes sp.]